MLLLNMTLAIVFPRKADHRIRTGHVRKRIRDRSEVLGVRTFLVSFEIVSLTKSRDVIRVVGYWTFCTVEGGTLDCAYQSRCQI